MNRNANWQHNRSKILVSAPSEGLLQDEKDMRVSLLPCLFHIAEMMPRAVGLDDH